MKTKTASAIDYVQSSLPPQLFELNGPGHMPYMRDVIRNTTIKTLSDVFEGTAGECGARWWS